MRRFLWLLFVPVSVVAQSVESIQPLSESPCVFVQASNVGGKLSELVVSKINSRLPQDCKINAEKFSDIFTEGRIESLRRADENLMFAFWLGYTSGELNRLILRVIYLPEALQWSAGFAESSAKSSEAASRLVFEAFDALPFVGYLSKKGFTLWSQDQTGPFSMVAIKDVNRHPFLPQILYVLREEPLEASAHLRSSGEGGVNLVFKPLMEVPDSKFFWLQADP